MGLISVLVDFFARTGVGAATVLAIIGLVGIGMRRRSPVVIRRIHR